LQKTIELTGDIQKIGFETGQALDQLDASGLDRLEKSLADSRDASNRSQQDNFNNAIAEAGLTGLYNGNDTVAGKTLKDKQTQDAAELALKTALQNANITGYDANNNPTLDRTKANLHQ